MANAFSESSVKGQDCRRCHAEIEPRMIAVGERSFRVPRRFCDPCAALEEAERFEAARLAAEGAETAAKARLLAKIPDRYREAQADHPDVLEWLGGFLEGSPSNLMIGGPVGTGKTRQAWGIWREIVERGRACSFQFGRVSALLDRLRPGPDGSTREPGLLEACQTVPLLILDDLGAQKTTDWAAERLYEIIDERYVNLRPTVVTSNRSSTEIAETVGERLVSRISEDCRTVLIVGPDRRRA